MNQLYLPNKRATVILLPPKIRTLRPAFVTGAKSVAGVSAHVDLSHMSHLTVRRPDIFAFVALFIPFIPFRICWIKPHVLAHGMGTRGGTS